MGCSITVTLGCLGIFGICANFLKLSNRDIFKNNRFLVVEPNMIVFFKYISIPQERIQIYSLLRSVVCPRKYCAYGGR